ncbi:hypothetical protein QO017_005124 [Methylobacterium gregans]|nr:hypothetical protein [Methylobacterium gregans]
MDEKQSVKQALAEESLLWFTRIMFKARFNSRFIVNPLT